MLEQIYRDRWPSIARPSGRSVTIWIDNPSLLAAAEQLARDICARFARTPVQFVIAEGGTAPHGWESYRAPRHRMVVRWMLKRLRTQTLIVAGSDGRPDDGAISAAHARGASLILLKDSGVRDAANGRPFDLVIDADTVFASETRLREKIDTLITRSRKQTMVARGGLPARVRILRSLRRWCAPLLALKFREYRTVGELRAALRFPESILCLGNGPSSETPAIRSCEYQCLFRVNMSWQQRGFLVSPDLVFTGLSETVAAVRPDAGFVFGAVRSEEKILGRHLSSWMSIRYACCERLGFIDSGSSEACAPTNGALMVAVAAALRPRRLIVAGIDLYAHPQGAYPDDSHTANAYAAGHDARTEVGYLAHALRSYEGELLIHGEALRDALAGEGIPSVPLS